MEASYDETKKPSSSSIDAMEDALKNKLNSISTVRENPVEAMQRLFSEFDTDNSGHISKTEFKGGLATLNFTNMDDNVEALFRRYDTDYSGHLSLQEFGKALFKIRGSRSTSQIGRLREVMAARAGGFAALKDLGRQFKFLDKSGGNTLDKAELAQGLATLLRGFGVKWNKAEYEALFEIFDRDRDGQITYDEFLRGVRGGMTEFRLGFVRQAFALLDTDGSGVVELREIANHYDCSQHPGVKAGKVTPEQVLREFMKQWDKDASGDVTMEEFVEYYEWVSPSIANDTYWELMMRNAWHISGGEGQAANTSNRRVLVTHGDGRQTVEEVKNDLGIGAKDKDKMMANLVSQGVKASDLSMFGSMEDKRPAAGGKPTLSTSLRDLSLRSPNAAQSSPGGMNFGANDPPPRSPRTPRTPRGTEINPITGRAPGMESESFY